MPQRARGHEKSTDMREQVIAHMKSQFGLSESQLESMMPTFIQTLGEHLDELETAVSGGDLAHIGRAAHTLKGALLNLGLGSSADTALTMEKDAKAAADGTDYAGLLDLIKTAVRPLFD